MADGSSASRLDALESSTSALRKELQEAQRRTARVFSRIEKHLALLRSKKNDGSDASKSEKVCAALCRRAHFTPRERRKRKEREENRGRE